jgi:hypothetical protein
MRVLSPERHQPPPLPDHLRRLRRLVLAPPAVRSLEAERSPEWPHTAIPRREELPQPGERLRCHVLIPAHDEEVVIGATLTSLSRQRRPPLLQLVPPRRRSARDAAREARREARIEIA